ncbi:LysR family transcriptional regulator [Piscinibacter aquaticus]|uniref:LysR family transcriptional regulator n=1 Tax=Piscinibacter aquaticus TaxID=392597 RepID=A0A5C6U322_9BURK|nr:LysR family transcriptional regulator [Piscinibacter aquaticus]
MNLAQPSADIELRLWRQFLAVAETLHFGRAAAQLHMTQPPLTQAIQQLERRLGVPLFERTRRSVVLTPAGAAIVEPARQLLAQAAALAVQARSAASGETGRIRLGFVSTVGFGPLPGWLRAFREAHPGIAVELREATGDVQYEAFAQRELDAGFVLHAPSIEPPPPLQRLSLGVEPLLLAVPDAGPQRRSTAQWLREPLVIFPRSIAPSLYDAVLAFYHRHGVTPAIAQEAIQMQTIVNLVSAGLGVALVPRAMQQLQRPGITYRALPAGLADGAPRAETSLVWLPDAAAAVRRFVEFVRAQGLRGA